MTIPAFLQETVLREVLVVLGITLVSVLVSRIVVFLFNTVLRAATRKTRTKLDDLLIQALGRPVFLMVSVFGGYLALTGANFLDAYQTAIDKAIVSIELILLVYLINRVARAIFTWYSTEVAPRTQSTLDERLLPIVARAVTGGIYALGVLMVIRAIGVDITPLLAGLGIGGLAVALALQPTLNNLIAGAYTVSESKIGVGDFIRLQDGPEGVVQDIGWRTTKILTSQNNVVVIPNARLADTIVTNFQAPAPEMVAVVECGVAYECDLEHVQRVTEEVAREVIKTTPGAAVDSQPGFRFRAFGDSNIDFQVLLRVQTFRDQFPVVNEFIKRLHQRFRTEGIEINYPVRRLIYTASDGVSQASPEERAKV